MTNNTKGNEKNTTASMILPVTGVIVGAAVMAVVSNHQNQKKAQVILDQVKEKASSYMKVAKNEVKEGKKKVDKTLDVVEDSDKKVAGIWKK